MLTRYSIKRPFTIFVAVAIVIVFGFASLTKMTPDLFPKINAPVAVIITSLPGASAEEVEMEITDPLEQQLATLSKLTDISSLSSDNMSAITMAFSDDVDMDVKSVDIREKVDLVKDTLPENASAPVVMKMSMDMMPVVVSAVGMKGKTPAQASAFMKENLESQLEGIEGVASVNTIGMVDEGIQIILSADKIQKINEEVAASISSKFSSGEQELKKGIKDAQKGSAGIQAGKDQIVDGVEQANAAIKKLEDSKKAVLKLKKEGPALWEAYMSASTPEEKAFIEAQIEKMGFASPEDFKAQLDNADATIESINDAINEIQNNVTAGSFTYSDINGTKSTLDSVVSQLQMSLSQIESQKEAAIDSADMTGVITMENISAILNAQNFSMPAGYVTDGEAEILVSVGDKIKDTDELKNLILFDIGIEGVDPIKLKDVATVSYIADDSNMYARIDGENGILLAFTKQSNYATATVADNINEKFQSLEKEYDGLSFTALMDQGEYIHVVINSVLKDLILGAIFAILILLFFLRDIRPTAITAISIPVSVIFAITAMYFTGVTLNMISLSGLAIGVGMLVDNSIVVIENIYRLRSKGYTAVQAAFSGAAQVAGAITASTFTTICVFVPIVFVDGMTRELFTDLALTVAFSLLASLLIALTFVPAVAKGILVKKAKKTVLGQKGRVVTKYRHFAAMALLNKKKVVAVAILLLISSTGLLLIKGFEFMPAMSTSQITATVTMPEDSTLDDTARVNDHISDELRKIDGVESVGIMLSSSMSDMMGMAGASDDVTETSIYVILDEKKVSQGSKVTKTLEEMADKYNCEIISSADMDMTEYMGGSGVNMTFYGDDLDTLRKTGMNIEEEMKQMDAFEEVSDVEEASTEEIHVVVNKNSAMKHGLTVAQVYQQVASALSNEKKATTMSTGENSLSVNIEKGKKARYTRQKLTDMKLTAEKKDGTKEKVMLSSIATIKKDASLNQINHTDQKRSLTVTGSIKDGYNITKVTSNVKELIKDKDLVPADITVDYGGENEEIMHAMKQMLLMLLVGSILVYLIMVAQFQSLRSPFIIIFTLPLAFTGGMLALLITNQVLSVIAMMGFVMLVGIVVNNGIVLVDCINRFRLEGLDIDRAIVEAGAVRMRPVLMTAATTVLGLIPLALGIGQGSEMVQPVAIVCIGGLIYATVTTLFVIPVMYRWLASRNMKKIDDEELEIVNV